jgi:predicted enzyme related to lactoylglutathione lyase
MSSHNGKFVWYELMTSNPAAAEKFYKSAIGWNMKDAGMPDRSYTVLSAGESMVGGLMAIPDDAKKMGAQSSWVGYIAVDDVDAYAKKVTTAGGKIMRAPDDIPGVGRFAVASDPHGAVFLLFRGAGEPPANPPAPGTPGTVGWHELLAGDLDPAFAFYSKLFGWTKAETIDMGEMGTYQTFAAGGGPAIGGMMKKPAQAPKPTWGYYVNVDAIDATVANVKKAGGQIVNGPVQVPGGSWIINCIDPQGAAFSAVAMKR